MKMPNGYGSTYKLKGNRRKPWVARVTTGWNHEGKQERYIVGYFESRKKAIDALSEYHKNPIADRRDITLQQIYDEWSESKYQKISKKTIQSYQVAWKHLSTLSRMKFKDIKKSHLQYLIDNMNMSYSSCHKVKVLVGLLYKYAMADDIVTRNYAELIELPAKDNKEKEIFNDIEIKAIEDLALNNEWANTILILIYTGMRIGELLQLTKFNLDIDNMIIKGGIKTDAGKNRIIPIHSKIQDYIKHWYKKDSEYLINNDGNKIRIDYYRKYLYYPALEKANVRKLTPHSTRHTFASLMNRAKVKTTSIQKLIGHADYSTTANIYTHIDIKELKKAIEKI